MEDETMVKTGIKVSIIMPSLNVGDYIEEAVRSAMNQTLREIEILCIDAGSDDGTWEILTRLAGTDGRIMLCHSDIRSYGYQVNLGLDMARGEYIAVLETDDYVAPKMYERLYQMAVQNNCDYVKGDCQAYWMQDDGGRFFFKRKLFPTDELYGEVIEPRRHPLVSFGDWYVWSGIYKREFLTKNRIRLSETPGAAFQDIGILFQTNVCAKRALYLKDDNYRYCVDREGASSNLGRGLKYSWQEFGRLLKMAEGEGDADSDMAGLLYCRMAKSFVFCYREVEEGIISMTDVEKSKYYEWFREKLQSAAGKGIINAGTVPPGIWDRLEPLLVSEECYMEAVREQRKDMTDRIGMPREFPVVIFGCGNYGYSAYKWLKKQGYHIAAFMDNNKALWGRKVNQIEVEPPGRAETLGDSTKYLIANELYSGEIRAQLTGMGVPDGNIGIYV